MVEFHDDAIFPEVFIGGVQRFPNEPNSTGGPGFYTTIQQTVGGQVYATSRRQQAVWSFAVQLNRKKREYVKDLIAFVLARRGGTIGFRLKYSFEHNSTALGFWHGGLSSPHEKGQQHAFGDQFLGTGDGTTVRFPIAKRFVDAVGYEYVKRIHKPIQGTVLVGKNAAAVPSGFTVDHEQGFVDFAVAPADGDVLTCGFEYHFPVLFGEEIDRQLQAIETNKGREALSTITMVELLLPGALGEDFSPGGAKIVETASTTYLNRSARTWVITPTTGSVPVRLPDPFLFLAALGGPHFTLINASGVNTFALQTESGVAVRTVAPGESVRCHVAPGPSVAAQWFVVV